MKEKVIIYQVLPRLFGNQNTTCKENGTIEENGCGKLNNFSAIIAVAEAAAFEEEGEK